MTRPSEQEVKEAVERLREEAQSGGEAFEQHHADLRTVLSELDRATSELKELDADYGILLAQSNANEIANSALRSDLAALRFTQADPELLRSLADELEDEMPGNVTRYTINQIFDLADRIASTLTEKPE